VSTAGAGWWDAGGIRGGTVILEKVGDFFADTTRSLIATGVLVVLLIVWAVMQTTDFRKAFRLKKEGDLEIKQAELELQQQILRRLEDQNISEQERAVLLQQLSRPGRN
jgi:hypothetical protein